MNISPTEMIWITHITILINLIFTINCLNDTHQPLTNVTSKRVSAKIYPSHGGDFKIGVLVSVRLHAPGKKNTRNLECGKASRNLLRTQYNQEIELSDEPN